MNIVRNSFNACRLSAGLLYLLSAGILAAAGNNVSASVPENYRLRPTDKIEITVYGQEDLSSEHRISGEGTIKLPLLGHVIVAGMTTAQVESFLEERFVSEKFLRDPDVSVNVEEYSERVITVLGQVYQPGQVLLSPESNSTSISKAIAAAGGFTRLANTRKVKVVRLDQRGDRKSFEVDVKDLLEAESEEAFFTVLPGDVIYVKERLF